jgi:hypothetical protein
MSTYEDGYTNGYKDGWTDATKVAAKQAGMRLSSRSTDTQRNAVNITLPRSGTKNAHLYDLFCQAGDDGLTDDEIETVTGWSHQSASASRNLLMNRGLLTDSGERRKNRRGLDVIVWKVLSPPSKETNDREPATGGNPDGRAGRLHQRDYHADHLRLDGERS